MAKILELAVNLSMLTSGNLIPEATKAGQAIAALQTKAKTLQAATRQIEGFQKQRASLEQLREKMGQARERVRVLREEFSKTNAPTAAMRKQFADAQRHAGRLEAKFQTQRQRLAELNSELMRSGINTRNLTGEQQKLAAASDKVKAAQDRLANAQSKFAQIRSQLDWGNMKNEVLASLSIIKSFQAPIKVDMDFEQAMAQVNSVAALTQEQFTSLRKQALELGSSTQFTATQAAASQEVLARAGLKPQEIQVALPHILQTAGAEGMDISQAADILINVTKNMNLPISEMGRVADVMAYTSAHSNTNIAQLGEAALKAAGPFASMGGSVEELMATLGAMSNTVRGAEAGTALSSVLRRLSQDPAEAHKELSRYGIRTQTRKGDFAPFAEIIAQVALQGEKLGSKTAAGMRGNIYGQFGAQMQGLERTLMNGEYSELLEGTQKKRDGASSRMNATRNDTLKGDITSLGSAWEGLMIRIGKALDPINRFFTQTLTKGVQKLNEIIDTMGPFADLIAQAAYFIGGFMVLRTVWKYLSLSVQAFKAFLELKGAITAIEGATSAFGGLSSMLSGLGSIIMAHPVIAIGTLVAGAVALAIANWDTLKEWWASWVLPNVWEPLARWCEETISYLKGIWEGFTNWLSNLNPFKNWDKPSVDLAAGKAAVRSGTVQNLAPSYMQAHATGGILTTPHIGLVAEDGPEAVIPLRDRARGVPLLMQAAELLGVTPSAGGYLSPSASSPAPATVNITVNVQGNSEDAGLAERIAQAVRDALSDIMSLEERVSYA